MCVAASGAQSRSDDNLRDSDLLCFQEDFGPLLGACDFQAPAAFCHEFASGFYHRVHHVIVVTRVMVKQDKRLNLSIEG